ncbi:MAG: 30S ribosomal protein S17 [Patescibacteria group bacterium]
MAQQLKGKVISNKMINTVVVEVLRLKKHPRYGKYIKISDNYKAHTNENIPIGSTVVIELTRPISKDKRWKVVFVEKRVVAKEPVLEDNISV